jgi:hypothetical protein
VSTRAQAASSRRQTEAQLPTRAKAAAAAAFVLLSACGGQQGTEADTSGATTFRAYAASMAARPPSVPPDAVLTASEQAEVAQLSRDWAVQALLGDVPAASDNRVTAPPLFFARAQVLSSAAQGDTLAQLRGQLSLPSSPAVWSGLLAGLSRRIGAAPDAVVTGAFMQAVNLPGSVLHQVSAADLALQPQRRLEVTDTLSTLSVAWPAATRFKATYTYANGNQTLLDLLRIQGLVGALDTPTYTARVLALPGQARLLQIVPRGDIGMWTAANLSQALDAVARVAVPSQTGELLLQSGAQGRSVGHQDTRGMTLAQDKLLANLKGLDGIGGTYAELAEGEASASADATGLQLGGSQGVHFIYNPLNGNGSGGVIVTRPPGFADCTAPATDLAPYFLALTQGNGSITILARMADLHGEPCSLRIVPPPDGP